MTYYVTMTCHNDTRCHRIWIQVCVHIHNGDEWVNELTSSWRVITTHDAFTYEHKCVFVFIVTMNESMTSCHNDMRPSHVNTAFLFIMTMNEFMTSCHAIIYEYKCVFIFITATKRHMIKIAWFEWHSMT